MPRAHQLVLTFFLCSAGAWSQAQELFPDPNSPFLPIGVVAEVIHPDTKQRYQLLTPSDYLNAHEYAEENGGWLWAINSQEEQDFVLDAFLEPQGLFLPTFEIPAEFGGGVGLAERPNYWIGMTDSEYFGATEGGGDDVPLEDRRAAFQWNNGDPVTFSQWSGGEPNDFDTGEDYAEINPTSGNWNDDNDRGSGLDLILVDGIPTPATPVTGRPPGGEFNMAIVEFDPTPPVATLVVNTATGVAELRSEIEAPLELYSYEVTSEDGTLDSEAWLASNLSARGVDATDPNEPGQSWDTVIGDDTLLLESYLLGASTIEPGESLTLGTITQPLPDDATPDDVDWFFNVRTSNPNPDINSPITSFESPIEFVTTPVDPDYNGNGVVDAADFTVWRDTLGATGDGLAADGNGDGVVDQLDYQVWKNNFGLAVASAGQGAVPEPAGLVLLLLALPAFAAKRFA